MRKKIVGTWKCTNVTKHANDRSVHAVEHKIFAFYPGGKTKLVEKKKGKSAGNYPYLFPFPALCPGLESNQHILANGRF